VHVFVYAIPLPSARSGVLSPPRPHSCAHRHGNAEKSERYALPVSLHRRPRLHVNSTGKRGSPRAMRGQAPPPFVPTALVYVHTGPLRRGSPLPLLLPHPHLRAIGRGQGTPIRISLPTSAHGRTNSPGHGAMRRGKRPPPPPPLTREHDTRTRERRRRWTGYLPPPPLPRSRVNGGRAGRGASSPLPRSRMNGGPARRGHAARSRSRPNGDADDGTCAATPPTPGFSRTRHHPFTPSLKLERRHPPLPGHVPRFWAHAGEKPEMGAMRPCARVRG
jgi:hypothetical protein